MEPEEKKVEEMEGEETPVEMPMDEEMTPEGMPKEDTEEAM